MNKDQVKGRIEEAKGNIKEAAGKAVGNERLQGEGLADQAAGKVQKTYGYISREAIAEAVTIASRYFSSMSPAQPAAASPR